MIDQQTQHLATKDDIDDFIKNNYFDTRLKNTNDKVNSNKTKKVRAENKLGSLIFSYTKLINNLTKEYIFLLQN